MDANTFQDDWRSGRSRILACRTAQAISASASPYAFGVAKRLQCAVGGSITVTTVGGDSVTVTLVAGGTFDCPTTALTAATATGIFAYI